jgi:DNA replication initiation complex subunit (GINS family)
MIAYNNIYEASRKERYSEQLQELPKNFVEEVANYLKEKKESTMREDDFSESSVKTKKQLENAITLFKELMIRRKKKILNLILIVAETGVSKRDFDNMLEFEKKLFEELMKCIDISDKDLNESLNIKNGKEIVEEKNVKVVFSEDVDEFLGMDGEKLGPFKKGEEAKLPKEIAKILLESGKAK